MANIRWFGGRISLDPTDQAVAEGSRLHTTGRTPVWAVGEWAPAEIRTAAGKDRQVTVFGHCTATDPELRLLAAQGVTDRVLTAFAGSYTVVESTAYRTTVFTNPSHTWPIYTASTAEGVVWGSSALALAALTNAQPDTEWLAKALLAPHRPDLLNGQSAFAGITSVPPGSRWSWTAAVCKCVPSGFPSWHGSAWTRLRNCCTRPWRLPWQSGCPLDSRHMP